jgi:hypothetical protein
MLDSSGGGGRSGVSGTGRGFEGGGWRFLGWSFGRRSRRSGIAEAGGVPVVEGIFSVCR